VPAEGSGGCGVMPKISITIRPLDPAGSGYPIELEAEGQPPTEGLVPAASLDALPWTRAAIMERLLDAHPGQSPDFDAIGQTLYGWLFAGQVGQTWDALCLGGDTPCLQLQVLVPELAGLPWELLCSPTVLRPAFLGGLVRLHTAKPRAPTKCSLWPLRILVVVGCEAGDEAQLGADKEIDTIERQFLPMGRSVDIHILERPSRAVLQGWLRQHHPHVLHFVGHGAQNPETGQSALVISRVDEQTAQPATWFWDTGAIPTDLAGVAWLPRFVFLNSCRSGQEREHSASVQRAFLDHGVPAVLAMQADVRGDLAGHFATRLYQRWAEDQDLVGAVRFARQMLVDEKLTYYSVRDWALPALWLNAELASASVPLYQPIQPPAEQAFERCQEFEDARFFADLRDFRRAVTTWFYPVLPPAPDTRRNILLVVGEPRSGKSHLVKWCLESCALSRARIRYIPVQDEQPKDFLKLLRQIRDGEPMSEAEKPRLELLHQGLDARAFRRFNWELANLLTNGEKGEWKDSEHPGDKLIPDPGTPLQAQGEKLLENIFTGFADALRQAAAERPVLLVFDQFGGPVRMLPKAEFEQMLRLLFRPIALGQVPGVKVVFVVTPGDHSHYQFELLPKDRLVSLTLPSEFTSEQLRRFVLEMFWYQDEARARNLADALLAFPSNDERGLGRLSVFRTLIDKPAFKGFWVERMR